MKAQIIQIRLTAILTLIIFFGISVTATAKGDLINSGDDPVESVNSNAEMAAPEMAPAPAAMFWMLDAQEAELPVEDLETTLNMIPSWVIEVNDYDLKVEDYKSTEEVIPAWMIIEEEPELEVLDLEIY